MRKSIFITALAAFLPFCAASQFVVESNSGTTSTVNGNVGFSRDISGDWKLNGVSLNDIRSVARAPHTGILELDRDIVIKETTYSYYFGDTYVPENTPKGVGNYYVCLTNDNSVLYQDENNCVNIPAHPGGYQLMLDVFAPLSADHKNPILPEGTYTVENSKYQSMTIGTELSWSLHNTNNTLGGLEEIYFQSGRMVVEHVDGGYDITGEFTTEDAKSFKFHFQGEVLMLDATGIQDDVEDDYIHEDLNIVPQVANLVTYAATDEYDEHVLRLFTTDQIDEAGDHCIVPGVKLQISFLSGKDGIAGDYVFGELSGWSLLNPGPGMIYPGIYMGIIASNSFLEQVNDDLSVKTSLITGGTLSITDNGNGTYTVTADFETSFRGSDEHYSATCLWTGSIDNDSPSYAPAKFKKIHPIINRK